MAEMAPLMKPLRADSLLRRPMPAVAAKPAEGAVRLCATPSSTPVLMHPAVFAPLPGRACEAKKPALPAQQTAMPDDDDDLLSEDAMPTEQMPVPVCVPLYEAAPEAHAIRWPWLVLAAAALLGAGYYAGRYLWPLP